MNGHETSFPCYLMGKSFFKTGQRGSYFNHMDLILVQKSEFLQNVKVESLKERALVKTP